MNVIVYACLAVLGIIGLFLLYIFRGAIGITQTSDFLQLLLLLVQTLTLIAMARYVGETFKQRKEAQKQSEIAQSQLIESKAQTKAAQEQIEFQQLQAVYPEFKFDFGLLDKVIGETNPEFTITITNHGATAYDLLVEAEGASIRSMDGDMPDKGRPVFLKGDVLHVRVKNFDYGKLPFATLDACVRFTVECDYFTMLREQVQNRYTIHGNLSELEYGIDAHPLFKDL